MENCFIEDQGEQRYGIIGMTRGMVLLLEVFVDRTEAGSFGSDEIETIHLISARKAEKYETQNLAKKFEILKPPVVCRMILL